MSERLEKLRAGFLAAVLLLPVMPSPARGAIDGSPHDLLAQRYVSEGAGAAPSRCVWCHLPGAGGDIMPLDPPPSAAYYSRSGLLCWSCHDGTTIVSSNVDASLSAFHPNSHPLDLGSMKPSDIGNDAVTLPVKGERLECVTCHSPHENVRRPFLRAAIQPLCVACHEALENVGYGTGNEVGTHPIHETMEDDTGSASPIRARPEFMVPFPSAYPVKGGRDDDKVHWRRGGHLLAGSEGLMECFTCHAVHGVEGSTPRSILLAVEPVRVTADEFCEGCHQGKRGDERAEPPFPNPGGTTTPRTYHPCDDDASNGSGKKPETRLKTSWPMGSGKENPIICTTCHVAHGGLPRTPALRRPERAETFCEECHLPENLPFHHPSGTNLRGGRECPAPPDEFHLGTGTERGVECYSCHVAHNAGLGEDEESHIPILRHSVLEDEGCALCHVDGNVTCLEDEKGTASHFLGDPTLSETYADLDPPLKTTAWPGTGLFSRYGGENEKKVVCLSCHSFVKDPKSELSEPLDHYLVAQAGDPFEWQDDLEIYLCTGCHGASPGTLGSGHTHPLMEASVAALGGEAAPPATYTLNGHLNCDSCHSAHGVPREGGYYILEAVEGANKDPKTIHPSIDFTVLCHLCHSADDY